MCVGIMESEPIHQDSGDITANVDEKLSKCIVEEYYGVCAATVRKLDGYDDLNFHLTGISGKNNIPTTDLWSAGYVLKIINSRESENVAFITEYVKILLHLNTENIRCPRPIMNKVGEYFFPWTDPKKEGRRHIVLMLTYQDDELLSKYKSNKKVSFSLGHLASQLHLKLLPFRNSEVLKRSDFPWSLEAVPKILHLLSKISISEERRKLVMGIVDVFQTNVLLRLAELEQGVIHNDLNNHNLLVKPDSENTVTISGVIDFADMVHSAYLFEIAIATCYLCLDNPDEPPFSLIASFLAGYDRRPLSETEYQLLRTCICARLCQSLVLGLYAHSQYPTNHYVLSTQKEGWRLLYEFHGISNEQFISKLRDQMVVLQNEQV